MFGKVKNNKTTVVYVITTFCFSYGLGFLLRDKYLLASSTMFFGFLQTYFMSKGKWFEEFFGLLESFASTLVCIFSCMYGSAIFTILVYLPLSVFSIINWKMNEQDKVVKLKKMSLKQSVLTILLVLASMFVVAYLLSFIPTQKLAFWNSAIEVLNICALLLIALRYKEGWLVWVISNFVELATWILAYIHGYSQNALMMIILSIIYIALNFYGYFSFVKLRKRQEGI